MLILPHAVSAQYFLSLSPILHFLQLNPVPVVRATMLILPCTLIHLPLLAGQPSVVYRVPAYDITIVKIWSPFLVQATTAASVSDASSCRGNGAASSACIPSGFLTDCLY